MEKSADAFRTISEVAADLALPQHVLRFWETRFPQIRPLKRAGGRRYYRPADVALLRSIRQLLYDQGYTIKGVQRLLKEGGARGLPPHAGADTVVAFDGMPRDPGPTRDDEAPIDVDPGEGGDAPAIPPESLSGDDQGCLRETLACIEQCERILRAALAG